MFPLDLCLITAAIRGAVLQLIYIAEIIAGYWSGKSLPTDSPAITHLPHPLH